MCSCLTTVRQDSFVLVGDNTGVTAGVALASKSVPRGGLYSIEGRILAGAGYTSKFGLNINGTRRYILPNPGMGEIKALHVWLNQSELVEVVPGITDAGAVLYSVWLSVTLLRPDGCACKEG